MDTARPRILLGITGSVAAVKYAALVLALTSRGADVRLVFTRSGARFSALAPTYDPASCGALAALSPPLPVYTDDDEWAGYAVVGADPVLHIALRDWADALLIAPLSAHTLSGLATGAADGLLRSIARAWEWRVPHPKPLVLAPAMNTGMWEHPATDAALRTLAGWGGGAVVVVPPVAKTLACGVVGVGGLAGVDEVADAVLAAVAARLKRVSP